MTHALREDRYEFVIISRSLLKMRKLQTKVLEKITTHFFSVTFHFFRKSRSLCGNVTLSDITQMCTGLCLCVFACDVPRKT